MSALPWSSPISPIAPPIPETWHWAAGVATAFTLLAAASWPMTNQPALENDGDETEEIIVSLGSPAQRLEAPPLPPDAEPGEEPAVVAERAEDAPPPKAPPEPRAVPNWTAIGGRPSSGTGGSGRAGPPAPPAVPPPPPPRTTEVDSSFVRVSTRIYANHIVYPPDALARREEGTGILRVTVNRQGRVLEWSLIRSTGHWRLDDEIERAAREVHQLDPLPSSYALQLAEVDVPIVFLIQYSADPG